MLLMSNKHVRDWPTAFADDEILTNAILDRLVHHVEAVRIDGRSYRLRDIGALLGAKPESVLPPSQKEESNATKAIRRVRAFASLQSAGVWVVLHSSRGAPRARR
jgi:hypothetical protein